MAMREVRARSRLPLLREDPRPTPRLDSFVEMLAPQGIWVRRIRLPENICVAVAACLDKPASTFQLWLIYHVIARDRTRGRRS